MLEAKDHLNFEKIIRYYLLYLPPRGCKSILDIGCGITGTYRCMLKPRTEKYIGVDVRPSKLVDIVADIEDMHMFNNNEFEWGWCTDVIEHIDPDKKEKVVKEIMRVCKNCVFIYPLPSLHSNDKNVKINSFYDDPGHTEVKIDWNNIFGQNFHVLDKSTKTGRGIIILTSKLEGTWDDQKGKELPYIKNQVKKK
jgi:SAM-dependent methyltransferase